MLYATYSNEDDYLILQVFKVYGFVFVAILYLHVYIFKYNIQIYIFQGVMTFKLFVSGDMTKV
jgi:hypothetical protein